MPCKTNFTFHTYFAQFHTANHLTHDTRTHTDKNTRRSDGARVQAPARLTHTTLKTLREPEDEVKAPEQSSGVVTVGRRYAAVGRLTAGAASVSGPMSASARTDAEEDGVDGTHVDEASRMCA